MEASRVRAPSWTREADEDTTLVWRTLAHGAWRLPAAMRRRAETDIRRVDAELRRALDAVTVDREWTPSKPLVLPPAPNVFLTPPTSADPPPPWSVAAVRAVPVPKKPHKVVKARERRRSSLPLIAFGVAFGIGVGLWIDRDGRADLVRACHARTDAVRAHVAAMIARPER